MSSRLKPPTKLGNARTQRLELTLESKVESAELAESYVVKFSADVGYSDQQRGEIGLAVREAVINAVLHGNRCDMNKKVLLTAEVQGSGLVICVRDEGEGFDPDCLADPLIPQNLLHETGRGFFLVKTCMDNVVVRRTANRGAEVTMIKYLSTLP